MSNVISGDLHSKILDAPRSKFFQLHAVFSENLAKLYVGGPPWKGWRPHLGEILDPPLVMYAIGINMILHTVFTMLMNFKNWMGDYIKTTLLVRTFEHQV